MTESDHPQLTDRQREVLALLADGLTSREAAAHLQLSEVTVNKHVELAGKRLGGRHRLHTVALAFRAGDLT